MDEQFLTLEGGQDPIKYWLHTDKCICERISFPRLALQILLKLWFCSRTFRTVFSSLAIFGNSFRKYERIGSQLSTILVKAGISVNHLQGIKSFSSKSSPVS